LRGSPSAFFSLHRCKLVLHMTLVDRLQLVAAIRLSLFCLGRGVRERWCVAHPSLVWENSPWWWFEFVQSFQFTASGADKVTCCADEKLSTIDYVLRIGQKSTRGGPITKLDFSAVVDGQTYDKTNNTKRSRVASKTSYVHEERGHVCDKMAVYRLPYPLDASTTKY
jgi:hypothetical protein